VWPLFPSLELRLKHTCSLGPGLNSAIFSLFFRCERALRGVPNARRTHYSFRIMRLLSLPEVVRVKREAESALERFEELQKEVKRVFLLEELYSHSLSESCRI